MSDEKDKAADGRALWARARAPESGPSVGQPARVPGLDEMELAAYLDGTLEAQARARVEGALAREADRLDLLIAAREALEADPAQAGPSPALEASLARAQALVGAPPPRHLLSARARDWLGRWSAPLAAWLRAATAPGRGLAYASFAAGFLATGAAGFELGRAEVAYSAQVSGLLAQEVTGFIGRDGEDLL